MRTTIEITEEHRARLLEIAARRGLKGFSAIVHEALEHYLEHDIASRAQRSRALEARGALSEDEAEAMRERVSELRERWR
jgi:Arc/MetJ family transcription regulator